MSSTGHVHAMINTKNDEFVAGRVTHSFNFVSLMIWEAIPVHLFLTVLDSKICDFPSFLNEKFKCFSDASETKFITYGFSCTHHPVADPTLIHCGAQF